jgi:uncharacterized membrane protein
MKTLCVALSLSFFSLVALAQDSVPTGTCVYQKIPVPNVAGNVVSGINDVGAIVGSVSRSAISDVGFLLFNGKTTTFRFPGSLITFANGINNHAQIAGSASFPGSARNNGFVVRDGVFHLIVVPNSRTNDAAAINDKGDIVGNVIANDGVAKGYLLHNGTFHIFRFPGSARTVVSGINRDGIIIGHYRAAPIAHNIDHGFMVKNGVFTTLDFPGAHNTFPDAINDEGDIVGSFVLQPGATFESQLSHGFLFHNGQFRQLNDPPNAEQNSPTSINNHDEIVTVGLVPFAVGFTGDCHAAF